MSSDKKKDPWWWNLIATVAGIVLLISSIFDYDKFITVDHNDTSKSRGFADFLASLDDMGGQKFVVTFLVVFVLWTIWLAYKDYKNRFDD